MPAGLTGTSQQDYTLFGNRQKRSTHSFHFSLHSKSWQGCGHGALHVLLAGLRLVPAQLCTLPTASELQHVCRHSDLHQWASACLSQLAIRGPALSAASSHARLLRCLRCLHACGSQVLATDVDHNSPSLMLFLDKEGRMLFNAGEGLQRMFRENKIKMQKVTGHAGGWACCACWWNRALATTPVACAMHARMHA